MSLLLVNVCRMDPMIWSAIIIEPRKLGKTSGSGNEDITKEWGRTGALLGSLTLFHIVRYNIIEGAG